MFSSIGRHAARSSTLSPSSSISFLLPETARSNTARLLHGSVHSNPLLRSITSYVRSNHGFVVPSRPMLRRGILSLLSHRRTIMFNNFNGMPNFRPPTPFQKAMIAVVGIAAVPVIFFVGLGSFTFVCVAGAAYVAYRSVRNLFSGFGNRGSGSGYDSMGPYDMGSQSRGPESWGPQSRGNGSFGGLDDITGLRGMLNRRGATGAPTMGSPFGSSPIFNLLKDSVLKSVGGMAESVQFLREQAISRVDRGIQTGEVRIPTVNPQYGPVLVMKMASVNGSQAGVHIEFTILGTGATVIAKGAGSELTAVTVVTDGGRGARVDLEMNGPHDQGYSTYQSERTQTTSERHTSSRPRGKIIDAKHWEKS